MTEKQNQEFEEILRQMPYEAQKAFEWLINNWKTVSRVVAGDKMTEDEIMELSKQAAKEKDYVLLLILQHKRNVAALLTDTHSRSSTPLDKGK